MLFHLRTPFPCTRFIVRAELRVPKVCKRGNSPYSQNGTLHNSLQLRVGGSNPHVYFFVDLHVVSKPSFLYFQSPRNEFPLEKKMQFQNGLPGTARALPGRWTTIIGLTVRTCISHPASGVPQVYRFGALWCVLLCCRCGLFGTFCSTAVVLLWWVGRWVGGGCLVGGDLFAIQEMAGGRKNDEPPRVYYRAAALKTSKPTKCSPRTGIPPYILLHCCTVMACSVGGEGARGWVERVV